MRFPDDAARLLTKKFQNKHREWLSNTNHLTSWPLEISLEIPIEKDAMQQPEQVRSWISAWQQWRGVGTIIWCERHWQRLGTQRVPQKLILQTPDEIALWVGQSQRWQLAKLRFDFFIQRWSMCIDVLPRYFAVLADYSEVDFQRVLQLLAWLAANPNSNLYPRQLPISGIDSKWLEKHKTLIGELFSTIQSATDMDNDFFQCCGLKKPPKLLRLRILDSLLRNQVSGLCDLSIPWEEAINLHLPATTILIVENLQTGLAFSDIPGTIVIMGLGYHVEMLAKLPLLAHAHCFYWGDIDSHGFAILNRLRIHLPNVRSLLMNEETLLNHRSLWVSEQKPHPAETLHFLTENEQSVYHGIKQHRWHQNLRLEQERIDWNYAMRVMLDNMHIPDFEISNG